LGNPTFFLDDFVFLKEVDVEETGAEVAAHFIGEVPAVVEEDQREWVLVVGLQHVVNRLRLEALEALLESQLGVGVHVVRVLLLVLLSDHVRDLLH
jgi:hypothetical protein